jgi:hypothetical protein
MPPALSKSKSVRVLLALLLIQVSFASSGGAEDASPYVANPNPAPLPPSPASPLRLSYTMLDVVDSVNRDDPSGYAWKTLLEDMKPIIGKRIQDQYENRVLLNFLEQRCKPNPSCDTVSIYKEKDSYGVIRYRVSIHCNTKFEHGATSTNIDAVDKQDIMDQIAEFIGSHDDRHVYGAEKEHH